MMVVVMNTLIQNNWIDDYISLMFIPLINKEIPSLFCTIKFELSFFFSAYNHSNTDNIAWRLELVIFIKL